MIRALAVAAVITALVSPAIAVSCWTASNGVTYCSDGTSCRRYGSLVIPRENRPSPVPSGAGFLFCVRLPVFPLRPPLNRERLGDARGSAFGGASRARAVHECGDGGAVFTPSLHSMAAM